MTYRRRFERKYIIDFATYLNIKKDIEKYFVPDKYGDKEGRYTVSSLYYDSPDWRFYNEKEAGIENRVKVRLRTYKDLCGNPLLPKNQVLLEIKRKFGFCIVKKKLMLEENEAKKFLEKPDLNKEFLNQFKDKLAKSVLIESAYLKYLYNLRPAIVVKYIRQAFVNKFGPPVRITFDSNIKYRITNLIANDIICKDYSLNPKYLILEIKYDEIFPIWIERLIEKHNLPLQNFSKYCESVDKLFEKREAFINT